MIKLEGQMDIIENDESLSVYRDGDVVYIDGKPQKINKVKFEITCNVQPMNGRDLLLVPEGDRYKEQYILYTNNMDTPIKTNDRVKRECKNFQVQSLENWGSYQRARIMLIDVGEFSDD